MDTKKPKDLYISHVKRDLLILVLSIVVAVILAQTGLVERFVVFSQGYGVFASLVAGMFFTSIFTIAPATVALIMLSENMPLLTVVFFGGLGALAIDTVIFFFVRERIYLDVNGLMTKSLRRHFLSIFHYGFMRWVVLATGAFLVASPFPDEIGLTLIGLSRVKIVYVLPAIFILHCIGIFLLLEAARVVL